MKTIVIITDQGSTYIRYEGGQAALHAAFDRSGIRPRDIIEVDHLPERS